MSNPSIYRPEIDGLRCLAVLSVLFYHVNIGPPGGYVGVDIFFVISGYLITSIIYSKLEKNTFSYMEFMARRIRRIFPPMFVVLWFSLITGLFITLPTDLIMIAKSAIWQLSFASNYYFFVETGGYFGGKGDIFPLLHTWSLSVEEQFYLFFPLLLIIIHKQFLVRLKLILLAIFTASIVLSFYGAYYHNTATFYLLPTRAWELGLGALIPILNLNDRIKSRLINESVSFAGVTFMFAALFLFDHKTVFPGLTAVLPCTGAFLFILGNSNYKTTTGILFSHRFFVGIGLISYSVYLWHWPLVAFASYTYQDMNSLTIQLIIVISSLLLGYLSWKYIESIFRTIKCTNTTVYIYWVLATLATVLFCMLIIVKDGYENRYDKITLSYSADRSNKVMGYRVSLIDANSNIFLPIGTRSELQSNDLFVWGDSHAQAIYPALDKYLNEHEIKGEAAIHAGVPPIMNYVLDQRVALGNESKEWNSAVFKHIVSRQYKRVILVAAWDRYLRDATNKDEFIQRMSDTINELKSNNIEFWVLAQVPEYEHSLPRWLAYNYHKEKSIDNIKMDQTTYLNGEQFEVFKQLNILDRVINPLNVFKDGLTNNIKITNGANSLYFDRDHLSTHGAELLQPVFDDVIDTIINSNQP